MVVHIDKLCHLVIKQFVQTLKSSSCIARYIILEISHTYSEGDEHKNDHRNIAYNYRNLETSVSLKEKGQVC